MSNTSSIYTTLTFNGFVFGALMLVFEFLRTREIDIYAPRTRGKCPTAPKPHKGLFEWFWQIYHISDDEMLRLAGLDGYVMLRFLLFCTKVCTFCCIGAVVLMPVYYYAEGMDDIYGVDKVSLANVDLGGDRLWASVAAIYTFTAVFLYLIHKEYEVFAVARNKFFLGSDEEIPAQMNFSIQVEHIPPEFRTSKKLKKFFENIFPHEVLYATVEVAIPELDAAVERRNAMVAQVEDAVAEYEAAQRQTRPLLTLVKGKPQVYGYAAVCREEESAVDKIDYLSDQLAVLCAEVAALQAQAVAATEEEDEVEMEAGVNPVPRPAAGGGIGGGIAAQAKFDSFSTTSTLSTGVGINASSPLHVSSHGTGNNSSSSPLPVPASNSPAAVSVSGPDLLRKLGKQTSAVGVQVAKTGVQVASKVGTKVGGFVADIKDNIVSNLASATGFVTFKTRRAQVSAAQVPVISQQYPKVSASAAPAPSDILWVNMSATPEHTENVAYFTSSMYYAGLLCWSIVLAGIAALSEFSTLQHYLPFLQIGDLAQSVVQGLLPVLVMILFSTLLHWLMEYVARDVEKRKTQSAVQMEIFKWYFMYQIANVYLLLLAGSIFTSLEEAINDPASIVRLISSALPSVSTFFINFIITTWLGGIPLILLQAGPSATLAAIRMFVHPDRMTRPMLKNGPFAPCEVQYGTALPDNLYVLCIVLLYWVISPVILVAASAFFAVSYFAYKYQYTFVNVRSYESGGQFFYGVYAYAMTGLLTGCVLFIAYLGIKEGVAQAPAVAPLPLMILYCWRYTERQFKVLSANMPLDTAVKADDDVSSNAAHDAHEQLLRSFDEGFLKQPNIVGAAVVYPYPHRILGVPLLNRHGALNEVYVEDIPVGMDPAEYLKQLQVSQYVSPSGKTLEEA